MRVGWGVDAHRLIEEGSVRMAGQVVDATRGVAATSDGDVVAHAVADAVLGGAALGDLGTFYPSDDPQWKDADSMELLRDAVARAIAEGFHPASADITVVAESIRVAPHREAMRAGLADALGVSGSAVSVKATSTDGLGLIGRDEGVAALAVVVLVEDA
jgi:2-C-methyl-D-erythritol 2,4-cyclodiphosphate synthase